MEHVRINIETVNAAFEDAPASELARILRQMADKFEAGQFPQAIRDVNGNICGEVVITPAE